MPVANAFTSSFIVPTSTFNLAAGEPVKTQARSIGKIMSEANKQYEAMFLLPAGASADVDGSVKAVRGIIERHGGEILVIKKWDERKLAYEIKSQKRGLYVIAYFRAPGKAVTAIEREVNLSETMLRVLITHADHLNTDEMNAVEPQPIIKEERPSWERPEGGMGGGGERRPFRPREDRGPRDDRAPREAGAAAE